MSDVRTMKDKAPVRIVNLTPHAIVLRGTDGVEATLPPSGTVARVTTVQGTVEAREGFPCLVSTAPTYGAVEGLPDAESGVVLIVSAMVLARCAGRDDVFGPGTGPQDQAIRDEAGRVVAVTRLVGTPRGDV
jgi:hypothetical protein